MGAGHLNLCRCQELGRLLFISRLLQFSLELSQCGLQGYRYHELDSICGLLVTMRMGGRYHVSQGEFIYHYWW